MTRSLALLTGCLLVSASLYAQPAPFIDPADDAAHFGDPEFTLFWTPPQQVAGCRNMDKLVPVREIRDGYIASVDEKVSDYLPRLKGSAYDQATLRDILQMASGVAWDETYEDPDSDVNQVDWNTLALYDYLEGKPRSGAPGATFNYNTAETNLVGNLLRAAIGNNLSTYLEEKIWRPFGMEADAYWNLTEPGGGEFGGCCINATLRDYGALHSARPDADKDEDWALQVSLFRAIAGAL